MKLPSIIALDPGGTTGYFWRGPDRKPVFGHVHVVKADGKTLDGHHLELWALLQRCLMQVLKEDKEAKLYIICEEFLYLKSEAGREKIDYVAKEYIGVVKLFAKTYAHHVFIRTFSAATAKQFWTDDKLKVIGFYSTKSKHVRDAARHYLYYVSYILKDKRYLNQYATLVK